MKLPFTISFNKIEVKRVAVASALALSILFSLIPSGKACAAELTEIDSMTFRGNREISSIHIGKDVTDISSSAFKGLMRLSSITVSENNPFYASYSNCLYNKDMTELLCFPAALSGAMIPDTVVSIGDNALYGLGDGLKEQIRSVIKEQASENITEELVEGAHFVHTAAGLKWIDTDGGLSDPDSEIKLLTASVIDSCTTKEMSQRKQLEKCFDYFVKTSSYERKMDFPLGDWTEEYAKEILSTGKGNCYNYAAAFAYIAKALGFDSRVCAGTVTSSLGGRTSHAWTEVKLGNKWYIFDTEMQGAKGTGYYKVSYDDYPAAPLEKTASWAVSF